MNSLDDLKICPRCGQNHNEYWHHLHEVNIVTTINRFGMQKMGDKELSAYADAVKNGIQPDGTTWKKVEYANAMSDRLGRPYRGDDLARTFHPEIAEEVKPLPGLNEAPVPAYE